LHCADFQQQRNQSQNPSRIAQTSLYSKVSIDLLSFLLTQNDDTKELQRAEILRSR